MQQRSKIIVHAAGGAGINITDKVMHAVADLGDGFCSVEFRYIDTSDANIKEVVPRGEFWKVTTKDHSKIVIDGSGSDRRKNAPAIMVNVSEYLDANKFTAHKTGEYHMVIFSASGGSGSGLGHFIIKNLLERGIPVIAVIVGDSSNAQYAYNTQDTLSSLSNVAMSTKRALTVIYVNNHAIQTKGSNDRAVSMNDSERIVNKQLLNTLSTISMFLSNEHESLDYADMLNIIDQRNYSRLNIPAGLYGLGIYSKEISLPTECIPVVARSLTVGDIPTDTGLTLAHHKKGTVIEPNVLDIFKDQFPLHMVTYANFFTLEEKALTNVTNGYNDIMENLKNNGFTGSNGSAVDDDGFVC